jgi:hypothetical protein
MASRYSAKAGWTPSRAADVDSNVSEGRNVLLRIRGGPTRYRVALNVSFAVSPSALTAAQEAAGLPLNIASAFFGYHRTSKV